MKDWDVRTSRHTAQTDALSKQFSIRKPLANYAFDCNKKHMQSWKTGM